MPHQNQHLATAPAAHHRDLRAVLDWLTADADFAPARSRGTCTCTWTPRGLACTAALWARSDEPPRVERFAAAREVARLALGLDNAPAATYQAFLKLLRAWTATLA